MSQHIKTGYLRYFYKGLLSKQWKNYYFILFDDSTLQWYEKQNDRKPDGSIRIRDIAQNLCVGPYTRCLSNRPELPRPTDEANLIALPRSSPGHDDQEIIWILCNDVTHLNDWMKAIISTLPPPPQQPSAPPHPQQNTAIRSSAHSSSNVPLPYPRSTSYPRQQQPIYPKMHDNQQPTYHYTNVIVQPLPSYSSGGYSGYNRGGGGSSLISAGVGFAGGALLGGALGYAWEGGFGGHGGWGYGMGPIGHHSGYGGWGFGDNDTTVINNYYDNDTTNNYNNSITNNDFSTYNETNNYNDNDNQQNDFQYETNNNQQSGNNSDGGYGGFDGGDHFGGHGSDNYGGDGHDYDGGGADYNGDGDDYGGSSHDNGGADYSGGGNDYGGCGDDYNSGNNNYGGDDFGGGGGDFRGSDFGNGDW